VTAASYVSWACRQDVCSIRPVEYQFASATASRLNFADVMFELLCVGGRDAMHCMQRHAGNMARWIAYFARIGNSYDFSCGPVRLACRRSTVMHVPGCVMGAFVPLHLDRKALAAYSCSKFANGLVCSELSPHLSMPVR
jgi:hypothetical protein